MLSNTDVAELLAQQAETETGIRVRAFRRAARSAFLWPDEVSDLIAQNRSLTELRAVGPFIEKQIRQWIEKPQPSKPASMNKKDVMAFVRQSYDKSIAIVSKLTPEQISKSYGTGPGSMTGLELLMFVLDHSTHHRASAEMYLRAKGITPAEYQF